MYETCPKCSYKRQPGDNGAGHSCPSCGIVFSKWMKSQYAVESTYRKIDHNNLTINSTGQLKELFLHVDSETNPFYFYGRLILFITLVYLGWKFVQMDFVVNPFEIGHSFMHTINLVFHEAGHIIFKPLGRFMSVLGGSLLQILVPLIVLLTFLLKHKNTFAAAVALWWTGQSFMDLAPYIDDALDQELVLLGGVTGADKPGFHDWNNILMDVGGLDKHRIVANFADTTGTILIIVALTWAGTILYRQYKNLA